MIVSKYLHKRNFLSLEDKVRRKTMERESKKIKTQ